MKFCNNNKKKKFHLIAVVSVKVIEVISLYYFFSMGLWDMFRFTGGLFALFYSYNASPSNPTVLFDLCNFAKICMKLIDNFHLHSTPLDECFHQ